MNTQLDMTQYVVVDRLVTVDDAVRYINEMRRLVACKEFVIDFSSVE